VGGSLVAALLLPAALTLTLPEASALCKGENEGSGEREGEKDSEAGAVGAGAPEGAEEKEGGSDVSGESEAPLLAPAEALLAGGKVCQPLRLPSEDALSTAEVAPVELSEAPPMLPVGGREGEADNETALEEGCDERVATRPDADSAALREGGLVQEAAAVASALRDAHREGAALPLAAALARVVAVE
jgi:hypothetical protein